MIWKIYPDLIRPSKIITPSKIIHHCVDCNELNLYWRWLIIVCGFSGQIVEVTPKNLLTWAKHHRNRSPLTWKPPIGESLTLKLNSTYWTVVVNNPFGLQSPCGSRRKKSPQREFCHAKTIHDVPSESTGKSTSVHLWAAALHIWNTEKNSFSYPTMNKTRRTAKGPTGLSTTAIARWTFPSVRKSPPFRHCPAGQSVVSSQTGTTLWDLAISLGTNPAGRQPGVKSPLRMNGGDKSVECMGSFVQLQSKQGSDRADNRVESVGWENRSQNNFAEKTMD